MNLIAAVAVMMVITVAVVVVAVMVIAVMVVIVAVVADIYSILLIQLQYYMKLQYYMNLKTESKVFVLVFKYHIYLFTACMLFIRMLILSFYII